ncbi:MAG TPA: hypothetical protein VGL49_04280 [Acidimicrobiales bacterium]
MKPTRRLLAGAAALLAVSLTASACDTSPYAARINSSVIKQTALYSELRAWAGNTQYVAAFNTSNSTTNGGSGLTIAGDGPGTYNSTWVANILAGMIEAVVVSKQLTTLPGAPSPSPSVLAAARSVSEISQIGWDRFSPAFRQTLVRRLADVALLSGLPSVSSSTLLGVYHQYQPYFFTQICTMQAAAGTLAQARNLAATGLPNANQTCYDQPGFEAQSASFQNAIISLAVGHTASPIQTSYGYLVVKVASRADQPFSSDVGRVLSVAINSAQGTADAVVNAAVAKARVQINPAFGTWKSSQVVPPAAPNASA